MRHSDGLSVWDRVSVAVLVAMWVGLGVGQSATAQTLPQFDLNQFRPSELTTDGFAVSTADAQGHLRFGIQIYMDYADDPLVFERGVGLRAPGRSSASYSDSSPGTSCGASASGITS